MMFDPLAHWLWLGIKTFLKLLERHQDLADILIKAGGLIGTIGTAIAIVWKYFGDRRDARRQKELKLRRKAFFDLFAVIPRQQAALGGMLSTNPTPPEFTEESFVALTRLHLLAGQEALRCIIERNAIYHKGMIELFILKKRALELDVALNDHPEVKPERDAAWGIFLAEHRKLFINLNASYRILVSFARAEIGLRGGAMKIVEAMERDQQAALKVMDGTYDTFRDRMHVAL